jgi:predicted PurR-regulated permease PerM
MPETEVRRALPLWLTVVLGVAGAAVAVWGIHAGAALLGPIFLALVLTVVVHPLVGLLTRRGMRRWLALSVSVIVVDGGLVLFAFAVAVSLGQLATVLPDYAQEWQGFLDSLRSTLTGLGIGADQVRSALAGIDPGSVVAAVTGLFAGVLSSVGALVLVLATVLFMCVDGNGLPERLAAVPGASPHLATALSSFARQTRSYIVVTTIFGLLVAVVDTVALLLLGVPLALLWGLLSFLTNYIPNIGFLLGLAPPVLLAALVGGPGLAVLVIVIYCVANFVLQSIVQPLFVGDVLGLSVAVAFLSVIAWTWVMGPLGAVLAIPLTLFVRAVLVEQDPDRRWARALLAGSSRPTEVSGRRPRPRRGSRRRPVPGTPGQPRPEPEQAVETTEVPD